MAITQIWRSSRVRAAYDREPVLGGLRLGRRAVRQVWTLLHAQGLIKGTAGSRDDVTFVEDDRRRMAGWRAN
jgi:hypothetical protein